MRLRGARAIWRALFRSTQVESEMHEEMRFHLQMEADRLAGSQGLDQDEAKRQARLRFGGVEKYKVEGREARGLAVVAILMAMVAACAALGPARRSLRLSTVDALRVDG